MLIGSRVGKTTALHQTEYFRHASRQLDDGGGRRGGRLAIWLPFAELPTDYRDFLDRDRRVLASLVEKRLRKARGRGAAGVGE